jgi:hypothetical protein
MRIRSVLSHSAQAVAEGALISLLVVGLMAGTAFAAKGGKPSAGTGGSLNLALVADANGNGAANWGDSLTFSPSTTSSDKPMVSLTCYQGSTVVYSHSAGFYPGYPWPASQTFVLSSAAWAGGAADCTARGYYSNRHGGFVTFATQALHVDA